MRREYTPVFFAFSVYVCVQVANLELINGGLTAVPNILGMVVQVVHVLFMFVHGSCDVVELHLQVHYLKRT